MPSAARNSVAEKLGGRAWGDGGAFEGGVMRDILADALAGPSLRGE
jgi:hypothetical protein